MTNMSQVAEEALMDLLSTGYAAASNSLKDTAYKFIENIISEMTLKGTFDDLFLRNLERWSQTSTFMNGFTQRVLNSRSFTSPLATFIKERMDDTVDEWRMTAKEEALHQRRKVDPTVPPSPQITSSIDDVPVHGKTDRDHAREHRQKTSKGHAEKYVPPFSSISRSSEIRCTDSDSSEDRKARREAEARH